MNSPDNGDDEFQRRHKELEEREQAIRLRELEAEVNQPPLHQTKKHQPPEGKMERFYKKLIKVSQFVGLVVLVVVTVHVAKWIAAVILVGAVAWVGYKIFVESDRPKQ